MKLTRRSFAFGASAAIAMPHVARAQTLTDSAGRSITVPARVERVFPAGPPAAITHYTLQPRTLLGWPRANRGPELVYLDPEVGTRPELGRLTGRGNTTNLEVLLQLKPDIILDIGSTARTFAETADRVQAQTGIPYALLDGRFGAIPESYRLHGRLVGEAARAEDLARFCEDIVRTCQSRVATVPQDKRPRVYYARGPRGLDTGLGGSINVETIEFMGAVNVAGQTRGGLATVSVEQVLTWDPEVIITIDQDFAANVRSDPSWGSVKAVRDGRVHLSPKMPFGWVDFPPSVNRMPGLIWLGKLLYPNLFPEDLKAFTRDFYSRFYHRSPTDAQIAFVLEGRG
ncbi:MAG: iron ABC transporter substrate-binding protein [Methylobacterium sp.]|jgi:iron complex transport system substrate-binding protein|nr:iron ABC transporter substrate-binding protein [Methylobacterium sp.]MCA3646652.1 iron ABC transporter substrate-binding protein [Methylobacterium sp.]MCA3652570.1 iron ABC transporter substrate-binding protein [Methylobacterium sp.]MCA4922568.1 iron ABC transporter substrate-binding protein [Methylobacterium sp.]MCZ8274977.1 iron ABC transporter substrate-binding protein [Microcystis sp. LE19-4.1E]